MDVEKSCQLLYEPHRHCVRCCHHQQCTIFSLLFLYLLHPLFPLLQYLVHIRLFTIGINRIRENTQSLHAHNILLIALAPVSDYRIMMMATKTTKTMMHSLLVYESIQLIEISAF